MNGKKLFGLLVTLSGLLLVIAVQPVVADGHVLADPIPAPIERGRFQLTLEPVASGLTAPNYGASAPGCSSLADTLFVSDQTGTLWNINLETGQRRVVHDLSARLVSLGVAGPGTFDERGFLGFAFHPAFGQNGLLYTYTSEPFAEAADFSTLGEGLPPNHQSVISEWRIPEPCALDSVVDPDSGRELLRIDQPQFNHNGGTLAFGPDNMLYVSLGDGGGADDQGVGHVPGGNGQDPGNILGTILRIDPNGSNAANGQYGIPSDNPFVDNPEALDEIYAYGFRNPYRFSFDAETGEMYIADVGQNDIEEIDIGVAGGNYGWPLKEGSFCFDPNGAEPGFVYDCEAGDVPGGLIDPIAEYDHDEGIAVVGGFVYRGTQIPRLDGHYVFGDYFQPEIESGRLFYLGESGRIFTGRDCFAQMLGFAQDAEGELYALGNETGTPFGETGTVLRVAPERRGAPTFRAHLDGDEVVPPVDTRAQGEANFSFADEAAALDYTLIAANVEDVFAANIRCAPDGINGPVGITLFEGDPISPDGVLAEGVVTTPDEDNGCGWNNMGDVLTAFESGFAYVNVETLAYPDGEIRGQIR